MSTISSPSMVPASTAQKARVDKLGYAQELPRSLSMITVLGLSFAIMAAPAGLSLTMSIGLTDGGPVTILWGWVLVTLISLCIAASLAEICSVFPTAGGVYYWSHLLSEPRYAPIASWITGWLGLVGNWTVTLSINFSNALLVLCAVSLWKEDYVATAWQTVLCFWGITLFCVLVNIFGNRWLDKLNTLCIWWTASAVIVIMVSLLVKSAPSTRRSAEFVFSGYDASPSGWPAGWAFFVGLLQAAYTLTGYGMVASMCDEVQNPERQVPRAMVLSVVAAGVTGVTYLIPVLFVLPDIRKLLAAPLGQPMPVLFMQVMGSAGGGTGLLMLILGVGMFAGIGSLTAASRCTWAFSRDGAIPFSNIWSKVNKTFDVPLMALFLSAAVDCLLGLIYLGSSAAFNAFTGVATICLSVSYGIPILVSLLRGRKLVRHAPFSLGNFGFVINIITVICITFAIVLFTVPTAIPVTPATMNYASVVFSAFTLISAVWYLVWGRHHYRGPHVTASDMGLDSNESFEPKQADTPILPPTSRFSSHL